MLVSVCMIVWNEEELLPKALASVEGLADEIIVVDTGSKDNTMEVARGFGARVFSGIDRMHKGEARNHALRAASGDWCVVLDADEQIADPVGFREFLEGTDANSVFIRLAFMDKSDNQTLSYHQMRAWPKGQFFYKYRAHEVPIPAGEWGKIARTDFVWEHRPPPDRAWKTDYTLNRLLLDVKENPDDPRPIYYLGRQFRYRGEWKEAAKWLERYLENPGRDSADAWMDLSLCYAGLGQTQKRIQALHQACAAMPMRRDWWGTLASIYHEQGNDSLAADLLKLALNIPFPENSYATHSWYGPYIHDLLSRCLWKLQRYEEGMPQAREAVALAPDNRRLWTNLAFFEDILTHSKAGIVGPLNLVRSSRLKNALFLTEWNCANSPHRLAAAVNTQPRWQARVATRDARPFMYEKDIIKPSQEQLEELYGWADVIVFHDGWPREPLLALGKPLIHYYHGTYYRAQWQSLNELDSDHRIPQLCSTLDLSLYGAEWLPAPMGELGHVVPGPRSDKFRVGHATTRRKVKGTDLIIEALADMPGVEVDIIEGVSHEECLMRTAACDVMVSQFELGYGAQALESWRLGRAVIADAREEIVDLMKSTIGYLPFARSSPDELRDLVEMMRRDTMLLTNWEDAGLRYLDTFHDPAKIGVKLIQRFEEATGGHEKPGRLPEDVFYETYGPYVHTGRERHSLIAAMVEGPHVLDFGCGTGDLLLILQEQHPEWTLHGVDISEVALQMAWQRGVTVQLSNTASAYDGLDTIIVSQVLEHVEDDGALLLDLVRRLGPGGLLIVTVPREDRIPAPDHKREYSEDSLYALLEPYGAVAIHDDLGEYRILATMRRWR